MKLLHTALTTLRRIGYFGSAALFLHLEWSYLYSDWTQILNPRLHLEVLATLAATPLFWLLLTMGGLGHYLAARSKRPLQNQRPQPQSLEPRELQQVGSPRVGQKAGTASSAATAKRQGATVEQRALEQRAFEQRAVEPAPRTVFQKVLQSDAATNQKLELLEWAIQSSQKVEFDYENRYGARSHRLVVPLEFQMVGQALCLAGYCRLSRAKRVFAVKRMAHIKLIATGQADSLLPLLPDLPLDSIEQDPQETVNQRPFLRYSVDELQRIANLEWHNRDTLAELQDELSFRTRKRARELRERIAKRMTELQRIARPSTKPGQG